MNYKTLIKILALALALVSTLSFASCDKDDTSGGDMTEQSGTSKGDSNTITKSENAELTRGYYNWIYADAFKGFAECIKKTTLPKELSEPLDGVAENKKVTHLRNIFCSTELIAVIQTASELENNAGKYTHNVVSAKRNTKGIYAMTIKFDVGGVTAEKNFELFLNENTRAVKVACYDAEGEDVYVHEIVVTNDGYVAVNRTNKTENTWAALQLIFKSNGDEAGSCIALSGMVEAPKGIYPNNVYEGFAGKK